MNLINYSVEKKEFPPVYSQTSISYLKRCRGFSRAKSGDMRAAESIVKLCVKPWRINEIKRKYPDAVLLPLNGKSKLPAAYAREIGLKTESGVRLSPTCKKTAKDADLHKFVGKIERGTNYILVDDVFLHDGAASALHEYVLNNGGFVCAIATLAYLERGIEMPLDGKRLNGLELSRPFFLGDRG